jgi:DNA invertase Pin-like site-specific DNA recombinase
MNHVTFEGPNGTVTILKAQVWPYARKSIKGENAHTSIEDQLAGCFRMLERRTITWLESNVIREKPGLGGHLYWEGGQVFPDPRNPVKTRPGLTRLVNAVKEDQVKLIVVWDFSRLWRSASIAASLLELFQRKGVLLADRHGFANLQTPEGKKQLHDAAAAYEQYRDAIAENTRRAFSEKRLRGEGVAIGRFLGFKRVGKSILEPIPEEVDLARRIYRMYVLGEQGSAPMSCEGIAKALTADGGGCLFPESRAECFRTNSDGYVVPETIRRVLRSPRYIAKQWGDGPALYGAREFLVNGSPVVDEEIWKAAQAKLKRSSLTPRRQVAGVPGSGILRCGCCAKTYSLNVHPRRKGDAPPSASQRTWRIRDSRSFHDCKHRSCAISHLSFLEFFEKQFCTVVAAEFRRSSGKSQREKIKNKIADLELKRELAVARLQEVSKQVVEALGSNSKVRQAVLDEVEARVHEAEAKLLEARQDLERATSRAPLFQGINFADESMVRESVREAIVWGAVVHRDDTSLGEKALPNVVGYVLFLTVWGSYHTAVIEKGVVDGRTPTRRRSTNKLRLLRPEEGLGTVMGLPNPHLFYTNLRREQTRMRSRGEFLQHVWAPGYEPPVETPTPTPKATRRQRVRRQS